MADGARPLHGILLIDKEPGWTSHDAVAKARGITRQRKIGHTGTLDPAATGLLVLCLGDATRLVEYMVGHDKRYEGTVRLGARTETDDAEGAVLEESLPPNPDEVDLDELAARFTGVIQQRPPAYSAVSVGGQRAYAVARRGGVVELAEREVVIHELRLRWSGEAELAVELHCGAGTYVRSLARDIGALLGCGAHLSQLRRTGVGGFRVDNGVTIGRLGAMERDAIEEVLVPPDEGIADVDAALVTAESAAALRQGKALDVAGGASNPCTIARIYDASGAFLGVGEIDTSGLLKPRKVLQAR